MEDPSTEEIDTKECPDSNELLRKIRARYATCSSYSDKGEFTKKVGRSGYSETFPFRTHFVRPGQVYLKFRDQDNTTILRSKRRKVIFLCQEDRDERKVFVPFRKYDSLEGALVNCFHHELFPTFILLLLNLDSFNEHKGVLDCDFSDVIEDNECFILRGESDSIGSVELSVNKQDYSLRRAKVEKTVKAIDCRYKKVKFDEPIPESVYERIKLKN